MTEGLANLVRKAYGYIDRRYRWWKIQRRARKTYQKRPDLHAGETALAHARLAKESVRSADNALELAEKCAQEDDPLGASSYAGTAAWKMEIARLQIRDAHRKAEKSFDDTIWTEVTSDE